MFYTAKAALILVTFSACSAVDSPAFDAGGSIVDAPAFDAGASSIDARAGDAATSTVDFLNLRIEDLGAYRAVIRFETSAPTTCEAEFGLSETVRDRTATDPNMEPGSFQLEHQVPLEDLAPETTYFVVARAENEAGDVFLSEVLSFTTMTGAAVDDLVNVAALSSGTTVTSVSSNYGGGANDSAWGVNNAFDDQMSTEWSSNGDGDQAFVVIDLGASRSFSVVGFRSRKMADGTSITKKFLLRLDGTTVLGPFDSADPDTRYLFQLATPAVARTVRFEAVETTGGNTGGKELQLFATP